MITFKNDDYVSTIKKQKRCKQSIIPGEEKKSKYYNGSKSISGNFKAEFKKAKNINN